MDRKSVIRELFDTSGRGLEIGPSYNPLLPKRDGFRVETLDHATATELREKYRNEPNVDASQIEEVDYVWDGRRLSEVVGETHCYDYVIASHLIEHTPDLLGFLQECGLLLRETGVLVLAVPDKRRCFDVFRPLSSTGRVLQAHLEHRTRHAPETAFDHGAYFATAGGQGGWTEAGVAGLRLEHDVSFAHEIFKRSVRSDEYYDFHAWTFVPSSFRMIIRDLNELGELALQEVRFQTTPNAEFFVTLSRSGAGCGMTRDELVQLIQYESCQLSEKLAQGRIALQMEVEQLRRELVLLSSQMTSIKKSTSWRLTAPLRTVGRKLYGMNRQTQRPK